MTILVQKSLKVLFIGRKASNSSDSRIHLSTAVRIIMALYLLFPFVTRPHCKDKMIGLDGLFHLSFFVTKRILSLLKALFLYVKA